MAGNQGWVPSMPEIKFSLNTPAELHRLVSPCSFTYSHHYLPLRLAPAASIVLLSLSGR
jgi:hypothetical protein